MDTAIEIAEKTQTRQERMAEKRAKQRSLVARSYTIATVIIATVAYVPLILTRPGAISVDTKQYLYLDPARYLSQVMYMWNPQVSLGTVTHQNIGYLLPMGPFFVIVEKLGIPVWLGQRIWAGSVLAVAGCGVLFLCKTLRLKAPSATAAAMVYMLSPYILQYIEHLSALMLPFSGLGFMIGIVIRSVHEFKWRYIGAFGLVIALTSSINATSIAYVGIAPALYIPFALTRKQISIRRALLLLSSYALSVVAGCIWWISGLYVEARYAINILKYTETVQAVASTSTASEVFRGLGYWYFYVSDSFGPVLPSSVPYQTWLWLIIISFALPLLAFVSAIFVKHYERGYFVVLAIVGMILSVGTYPYNHPTIFGSALKSFMNNTEAGLALRSTDRATPLLVIGLAILLAMGLDALKPPKLRTMGGVFLAALAIAGQPTLFTGDMVSPNLDRGPIPNYWYQAADYLSKQGNSTRVLTEPGMNFDSYSFGTTIDPILPGLTTRPSVERRQVPEGTLPSVDLLDAFDTTLQNGTFDPRGAAAIASLMSAGDILLQNDTAYYRYSLPSPQNVNEWFSPVPPGLGSPIDFGKPVPNYPTHSLPYLNEQTLSLQNLNNWPSPLEVFPVKNPRPILRVESPTNEIILDGGGSGIVAAADAGLLDNNPTIIYSGTLTSNSRSVPDIPSNATLVLTDSNPLAARRWGTIRDSVGEIQTLNYKVPVNYEDVPIDLFPKLGPQANTIAIQNGVASVEASSYGNPIAFTPEDRAINAVDGDPNTVWQTGGFENPIGQWLKIDFGRTIVANKITLNQPNSPEMDRYITQVAISFDGKKPLYLNLGSDSLQLAGQTFHFNQQSFTTVKLTITQVKNLTDHPQGLVGFSEININSIFATEIIRPPVDLLNYFKSSSLYHRLILIFSRDRVWQFPPRSSPQININRTFYLPTSRTFNLDGTVDISSLSSDQLIDALLGRVGQPYANNVALGSSVGRLPGALGFTSSNAFRGGTGFPWEPGLGVSGNQGTWIQLNNPSDVNFDSLKLTYATDGSHSEPKDIVISTEFGTRVVTLPHKAVNGSKSSINVKFAPLFGRRIRITINSFYPAYTSNYYTSARVVLPVAIYDASIPGITVPPLPATVPPVCNDNLLKINGKPVYTEVTGSTRTAISGGLLNFSLCGPDSKGVLLPAGQNTLTTAPADNHGGYEIDQINFDSLAGGSPNLTDSNGSVSPVVPGTADVNLKILSTNPTEIKMRVTATHSLPFYLTLGESQSPGWHAFVNGKDLGSSVLIDGYSNGWLLDPNKFGTNFLVTLKFVPQSIVNISLIVSALAILLMLLVALTPFIKDISRSKKSQNKNRSADLYFAEFENPLNRFPAPSAWVLIPVVLISFLAGWIFIGLVYGIALGWICLLIVTSRVTRLLAVVGIVLTLIVAIGVIVYNEAFKNIMPGSTWPQTFGFSSDFIYFSMLALLVYTAAIWLSKRAYKREKIDIT